LLRYVGANQLFKANQWQYESEGAKVISDAAAEGFRSIVSHIDPEMPQGAHYGVPTL